MLIRFDKNTRVPSHILSLKKPKINLEKMLVSLLKLKKRLLKF